MGYLDEATFLGDVPVAQTPALASELVQRLAGEVPTEGWYARGTVAPDGWVALPGGVLVKKLPLLIIVLLGIALFVAWQKKQKRK